jgi:hypothetical protein
MGRASLEPLPVHLSEALTPIVNRVAASIGDYFRGCAFALTSAHKAPHLQPLQDQLDACASQIAGLRQRNVANLSASQLEQLFALGFAFEQLQGNINDLERCVQEWVSSRQRVPDRQRT